MRKYFSFALGAVLLLLGGIAVVSQAQTQPRKHAPMYDPATEVTVKGTIEEVKQVTGRHGWGGTHLILKTDAEALDVHVGPSWFLSREKMEFAKGDEIEVVGSKITYQDAPALLAREITKGEQKLTLRDAQGIPVWARGHRK